MKLVQQHCWSRPMQALRRILAAVDAGQALQVERSMHQSFLDQISAQWNSQLTQNWSSVPARVQEGLRHGPALAVLGVNSVSL